MKAIKIITSKAKKECVVIDDTYSVVFKTNGQEYAIYNDGGAIGTVSEDQTGIEPFIEAFLKWKEAREKKIIDETEEKRGKEEKRVSDLKERILKCETPCELSDEFAMKIIETASHWSDLYGGRSNYAILISDRSEFEIIELAIEIHKIEGEFGESRRRDGEHHSTFNEVYNGMDGYQKCLKRHFQGDNFFYKSQETEKEFCLEQIKECDDIDEVRAILSTFDEIEDGYYDCNGNLEASEAELDDKDLSGYSYDVYSYKFCFRFENKNSFVTIEEIDGEN